MPSNTTAQDESGDCIPRWAATAGHQTIGKRLTAKVARLFRRTRQPHSPTHPGGETTQSRRTKHPVLRDYHATNLARARRASEQLVRDGWNIGPIPYGYRPHRVRIAGHSRRPRHRTRLLIEPVEAATVAMIYHWRVHERLSPQTIVVRLTDNHYPQPRDPITGQAQQWTVDRVTTILHNPKYLGRQVWGRRQGHRGMSPSTWVWSTTLAHPQIIDDAIFAAAQDHQRHRTQRTPQQ